MTEFINEKFDKIQLDNMFNDDELWNIILNTQVKYLKFLLLNYYN